MIHNISNRDRINLIRDIVQDLQGGNGRALLMDIISKAGENGVFREQVEKDLAQLKLSCEIIEARTGFFQVVL
jgi:hypothetical protein